MKKVRKAIFPVAGFGTRFLPITKSQPKEMLPIVDKPVIHYLVEEAVASGIEEIILVTGRGKQAIEDYFDISFELEYNLVERGKHDLLKEVAEIPNMARFVYVRQQIPRGDGHAILCAKNLIGNEPCAILYGDDLVRGDQPALAQLIEVYQQTGESVIGLTEIPNSETKKYGIVNGKKHDFCTNTIKLEQFIEKPDPKVAPSNLAVIGKYILTPDILEELNKIKEGGSEDGEIRLADGIIESIKKGLSINGKLISGKRYDAGSKIGFLKATIDFALEREDLRGELLEHLRNIEI